MTRTLIVAALPQELANAPLSRDLPLVYTGVGKLNAALSLMDAIARYQPEQVINFGTVGRISADVHGLVEVADVLQRDMDAEPLAPRGVTPCDDTSPVRLLSGHSGVRCATGDSFVRAHDPWLIEQGVDVVDMELFALALVCARQNIPWRSFKYITDDANEDSSDDWQARVHHGRELFVAQLEHIL